MFNKRSGEFLRIIILFLFGQMLIVSAVSTSEAAEEVQKPFSFAVSAMTSAAKTFIHFTEFRDYLAEKLGRPVLMKQRRTYEEINQLLRTDEVSMAFICTGGFLEGRRTFGLEVLATPIVGGVTTYQSYIIVAKGHSAAKISDLRGSVFAFTDPLSLTGCIYPTAKINAMGEKTTNFFKKTFYTASHDKSIAAVANGVADAAAVDSLIYKALMKNPQSVAHKVKVIETSEYFGMPPIVVSSAMSKEEKLAVLKILLGMESDPEGKRVLKALDFNGFTITDPAMYHSALLLMKQVTE
ncbi:MAG: phosphate/phosphite/phosphonate ABC transporter substrate-binding protein [Desulfuromusa sp.]